MDARRIRFATHEDARGILEAQHSAVHVTAANDYCEAVRQDWSPPVSHERAASYLCGSLAQASTLVAEVNGTIAGYAAIIPSTNELRDLYVDAKFGGLGVGSDLLRAIEALAREQGCNALHLNATLTAERFYLRHGYRVIERGEHTLDTGRKAPCVRMYKEFAQQPH
jgi:putative acetyltransferase